MTFELSGEKGCVTCGFHFPLFYYFLDMLFQAVPHLCSFFACNIDGICDIYGFISQLVIPLSHAGIIISYINTLNSFITHARSCYLLNARCTRGSCVHNL